MKIVEYEVVTRYNIDHFNNAIDTYIRRGFQPYGNISTVFNEHTNVVVYSQVMIKTEDL
jgi:hypothetical protein